MSAFVWTVLPLTFIGYAILALIVIAWLRYRRAEFIRTYKLPRGLLSKLAERYPGMTRKELALVSRGLRQFFIAYLMSGKKYVAMPSVAADSLWHEFILYTREYQSFCRRAFGGFLHHTPAVILSDDKKNNEGLAAGMVVHLQVREYRSRESDAAAVAVRARRQAQDPERLRLPSSGRRIAQRQPVRSTYGVDFSSSSFDGGTAGFGDGNGGGNGGGGCGGD